jgi:hypothetical protein
MRRRTRIVRRAGLLAPLLLPLPVFAHAFGQQYTLPLPVSLYVLGAGAAIIASFAILSLFSAPEREPAGRVIAVALPQWLRTRAATLALRSFGVLMLVVTIVTGFFGSQDASKNPALILFWIGLVLVVVYASALVAGLWERVDPFRSLVAPFFGSGYRPLFEFPKWLRYVPALAFFYGLLWLELLSYGAGAQPANIALLLVAYLVVTYFGVGMFGTDAWFRWGDYFSVFFGVVGRFAPVALSEDSVRLNAPGERLVARVPDSPTLLVFILLMLSSTSFDGLRDTQPWVRFFSAHPSLSGNYSDIVLMMLLLSPLVFLVLYVLAVYLMRLITRRRDTLVLVMRFSYSLVPIAIAYSAAHYLSLVISEGQNMIPMLSDPLGRGMDLFGTADYVYNPSLLSAGAIWYIQVGSIVLGHIAATYVAHRIAQSEFTSRSHVIVGQLPMLALMVLYTGFGLWILSLPYAV